MKTKNKHQDAGGEVTELAREIAKVEQYWIVGDRSEPRKPPKNYNYVLQPPMRLCPRRRFAGVGTPPSQPRQFALTSALRVEC